MLCRVLQVEVSDVHQEPISEAVAHGQRGIHEQI